MAERFKKQFISNCFMGSSSNSNSTLSFENQVADVFCMKRVKTLRYNSASYASSMNFGKLISPYKVKKIEKPTSKTYQTEDHNLVSAFRMFDRDGDGRITSQELIKVFHGLGIKITKEDAKQMISDLDKNENGTIEYCEFVQKIEETEEYDLYEVFEIIDLDGNGFICCNELKSAVKNVMSDSSISMNDVEKMMAFADQDGNGLIDFDEFVRILVENKLL